MSSKNERVSGGHLTDGPQNTLSSKISTRQGYERSCTHTVDVDGRAYNDSSCHAL